MKKTLKKFSTWLLVAIIAISALAVPISASSEGEYTVTIHKKDGNSAEGNEGDAYTGINGIEFTAYRAITDTEYNSLTDAEKLNYPDVVSVAATGSTANVYYDKNNSADTEITKKVDGEDGVAVFTLPKGLYVFVETDNKDLTTEACAPFAINLPYESEDGNVDVYPKNALKGFPDIDKFVLDSDGNKTKSQSISNGKNATWQIEVAVPVNLEGASEFKITDTLDESLTYVDQSINVYLYDGTSQIGLDENDDYVFDKIDQVLTITLNKKSEEKLVDLDRENCKLYIEFETTVNISDSVSGSTEVITNGAEVVFKNSSEGEHTNEVVNKPEVHNGKFDITKVDSDNDEILLSGAEFKLYTDKECTKEVTLTTENNGVAGIITDNDGIASVYGLAEGIYYLKEIKAPENYILLDNPVAIEITAEYDAVDDETKLLETYTPVDKTIENQKNNFDLPVTGGVGTIIFTVIGLSLVALAVVLFVLSKKKSASK